MRQSTVFASTTVDLAHAVLPRGEFRVTPWSDEQGINLGKSEIDDVEVAKLTPGTWRIESARWGAHRSSPGFEARWIELTVVKTGEAR